MQAKQRCADVKRPDWLTSFRRLNKTQQEQEIEKGRKRPSIRGSVANTEQLIGLIDKLVGE